jgi:hypothetical protein
MEKSQDQNRDRVQVTKAVFDGLEIIRQSGATNMLDRLVVLQLAREWDLTETADWIERVDSANYRRLIFQGPEIIEESLDEKLDRLDREYDEERRGFWEGIEPSPAAAQEADSLSQDTTPDRASMRSTLVELGKRASLAMADSYETEEMGVLMDESLRASINAERVALISTLIEASNLEDQLTESLQEVQRRIDKLTYLLDPENH